MKLLTAPPPGLKFDEKKQMFCGVATTPGRYHLTFEMPDGKLKKVIWEVKGHHKIIPASF